MNCKCNCNCRNGQDVPDFRNSFPGATPANATYQIGLTHYTCGGRKTLVADAEHPVTAQLTATPIGQPIDLDNNSWCQEVLISGTVQYRPCNSCEPRTEYVTYRDCLPCSSAVSPTITVGKVVASPKPIMMYQVTEKCGCCQTARPYTNQIAITTSVNVTTA